MYKTQQLQSLRYSREDQIFLIRNQIRTIITHPENYSKNKLLGYLEELEWELGED